MNYELILENKELLKVVYALMICFICAVIVLKTDRMFKLSDYQGLRYFRNAFFFYGLAFFVRFILGGVSALSIYLSGVKLLFEFFIVLAGFFLLYSLIWKRIEIGINYHSLFNLRVGIFSTIALLIALFDLILGGGVFMYVSQVVLFVAMSFISYGKYVGGSKSYKFLRYYFVMMLFGLFAWILNIALAYFLDWNKVLQMGMYGINILFFVFFLYAITKITNKKNG